MRQRGFAAMKQSDLERDQRTIAAFVQGGGRPLLTMSLLFRDYLGGLTGSVFFFILKHSPTWIIPIATANIINVVTRQEPNTPRIILINVVALMVVLVLNIPFNYLHTLLYAKAVRQIECDLRSALVRKMQQLSISYYSRTQSGRLQSKIIRDVEQVQTLSAQIFISVLSIITGLIVSFAVVITRSREVFVFFVLTIPAAVFLVVLFRNRIQQDNRQFRREVEETSAQVMEMVEMIPVTRAHAREDQETARMEAQLHRVAQKGLRLDMVQTYFGSISWVVFQVFQVLCLGFTAWMAFRGRIGIGDVTLYQTYFSSIVNQISNLVTLIPIIAKGLESVTSIGDVLREEDVEDNRGKPELTQVQGAIRYEDVRFGYSGQPILQHFNLDIRPGETIAFVGGSGSGKTTLINLAIGFLHPQEGRVLVDGQDLTKINLSSYRQHISLVPQQSTLFTGTIRDNITYGSEEITEERLQQIIHATHLEDVIDHFPKGLDTRISEHGANLSGGQRQRISIARAFVRDPRILVLDEATSALDLASEKQIQSALQELTKGRTTLIVAHRLSTIRNADRIAVIGQGGLLECGSYQELMEKKGAFYQLQSLQN
ncbi:MAG: ABC transporter [Bacillota bacterium]|nr:MAG: ABC transporter [Bacillota bacterium]